MSIRRHPANRHDIVRSINISSDEDIIVLTSETLKSLAEIAHSRMCPDKRLTFEVLQREPDSTDGLGLPAVTEEEKPWGAISLSSAHAQTSATKGGRTDCSQECYIDRESYSSEMGRSTFIVACVHCSLRVKVFAWSLAGSGKRCPGCDSLFTGNWKAVRCHPASLPEY